VADQTVEGVRNAEDGRRWAGKLIVTMPLAEVAKRARDPKEGASHREDVGRTWRWKGL